MNTICRHIGHVNLGRITPEVIDDMYIAMLQGDTATGRPASGAYVQVIHRTLPLVLEQAVKEGIIAQNPRESANPPPGDTKERKAMDAEQMRGFLAALDPASEHDFAFFLCAALGLRRGEVCGLSWGDVDWAEGVVSVHCSVDALGNLKGTKTKAGNRRLPMSPSVRAAFEEHRRAQAARIGHDPADDEAVVLNAYGKRLSNSDLGHWWKNECAAFGLGGWCLHELRHSHLTLLAMSGVHPKVMQGSPGIPIAPSRCRSILM